MHDRDRTRLCGLRALLLPHLQQRIFHEIQVVRLAWVGRPRPGTVAYRERMAMPENAVLTMQLQDVSNSAAPPVMIAEQRFTFAGHQVPLPWELHYDTAKIDPAHTYALSARIAVAGQVMFLNSTTYKVITHGNPTKVDMSVQMVEGQTGAKQ